MLTISSRQHQDNATDEAIKEKIVTISQLDVRGGRERKNKRKYTGYNSQDAL